MRNWVRSNDESFEGHDALFELQKLLKLIQESESGSDGVQQFDSRVEEHCCMSEVQWYLESKIPYAEMPCDDRIWYPQFLKGNAFITASFFFADEILLRHDMKLKFWI